jgi:hypothetical protein
MSPVTAFAKETVMEEKFERLATLPAYTTDLLHTAALQWSGAEPVPAIGATVRIRLNSIGLARVVSFASYGGNLGLMAYPQDPPDGWLRQNGESDPETAALVFGRELEPHARED